ncbi:signal peptidase II [Devosia sp.]|uniref:signal peptidase II n=1 Tax=Devosia sp. TaxID=1871048 RepID=UPI002EF4E326
MLLALALFADRLHKHVQIEVLGWRGGEIVPVTGFFDYVLVWNTGVSYGLFGDLPLWLLGLVIAAATIALAIWWWRSTQTLVRAGLALCIGGALSNAVDRLLYGAVADFFHFHWQAYSFYIFNIADTAITFGVLLLVLDILGIGRDRPAPDAA